MGSGCASLFKTNSFKLNSCLSSPKSKYKYFNVSPKKNDSIMSFGLVLATLLTFPIEVYPFATFVNFSKAWKKKRNQNGISFRVGKTC